MPPTSHGRLLLARGRQFRGYMRCGGRNIGNTVTLISPNRHLDLLTTDVRGPSMLISTLLFQRYTEATWHDLFFF